MTDRLPRELMESYCANSTEEIMRGFETSVIAQKLDKQTKQLMETTLRMGFECGWRIRETISTSGVEVKS